MPAQRLIGSAPNQVPTNGMLGDLAFQDLEGLASADNKAGSLVVRDETGGINVETVTATTFSGSGALLTNIPVASLEGVISSANLPSLAITDYLGAVGSELEMLAITGQRGDWVIRTDTGTTWILAVDGGDQLSDWVQIATPADLVSTVNGYTGAVVLDYTDVGAASAAQGATADTALQPGAIGVTVQAYNANTVVDASYVHTDNNYTTAEKSKLAGIAAGAEVNVNADWSASSGDAQILNKPTLGTAAAANVTDFATAAQGTLADNALPKSGGTITGNLTIDGVLDLGVLP